MTGDSLLILKAFRFDANCKLRALPDEILSLIVLTRHALVLLIQFCYGDDNSLQMYVDATMSGHALREEVDLRCRNKTWYRQTWYIGLHDMAVKPAVWLTDDLPVCRQGMASGQVWALTHRSDRDEEDTKLMADPVALQKKYDEMVHLILSGQHPCTQDDAVELAAYALQVSVGDHNPKVHVPGFLSPECVPKNCRSKFKKVEKLIFRQHARLFRLKRDVGKYRYIVKVRSLSTFGMTYFECELPGKSLKKKWKPVYLGFSGQIIQKRDYKTLELLGEWPWSRVDRWAHENDRLVMQFKLNEPSLIIRCTSIDEILSILQQSMDPTK